MRVLLVEDDSSLAKTIEAMLRSEQASVDVTDMGEEALEIAKLYDYDVILLDLMLPDIDGQEVIRRLRSARVKTPILVLSGISQVESRLKALDAGADDYLTKPFDKREMMSRLRAVVRRSHGEAAAIVDLGRLVVNMELKVAEVDGRDLKLTIKEYGILELLVRRRGQTVTKEMFLNDIYGGMDEPEVKIIDVFICKLRKKLDAALGNKEHVETVWGRGYTLMGKSSNWTKGGG